MYECVMGLRDPAYTGCILADEMVGLMGQGLTVTSCDVHMFAGVTGTGHLLAAADLCGRSQPLLLCPSPQSRPCWASYFLASRYMYTFFSAGPGQDAAGAGPHMDAAQAGAGRQARGPQGAHGACDSSETGQQACFVAHGVHAI